MLRLPTTLLLLASVLGPAALGAQGQAPGTAFGVTVGLNSSSLRGSGDPDVNSRVGFAVGAFARIPLPGAWSFQPEIQYTTKGAKETDNSAPPPVELTVKLSHIEFPLLFRVAGASSPAGQLFVEAGPALALNVGCTASVTSAGTTVSSSCSSAGADIKTLDVGGMLGAGYEFTMGTRALSVGVRYNLGIANIADGGTSKNTNLQFLAGLRF